MVLTGQCRDVFKREFPSKETGEIYIRYEIALEVTEPMEIVQVRVGDKQTAILEAARALIGQPVAIPVQLSCYKNFVQINAAGAPRKIGNLAQMKAA